MRVVIFPALTCFGSINDLLMENSPSLLQLLTSYQRNDFYDRIRLLWTDRPYGIYAQGILNIHKPFTKRLFFNFMTPPSPSGRAVKVNSQCRRH